MATKPDKKGEEANDWQQSDEDDNWDDWGDGDDDDEKFVHVEQQQQQPENNAKATEPKTDTAPTKAAAPEAATASASSSSGWGLWGGKLSSVLSTASEGLGNITTHVNQGLNQIIGVPDPEEMARINAAEQAAKPSVSPATEKQSNDAAEEQQQEAGVAPAFNLGIVTTLGTKVLNTGLDTLEGIGKKTMTILQDNDPKLMNKRKLLGLEANKPNLSAVLLEAKKDADQMEQSLQQLQIEKRKAQLRFDVLFENYCGLVHFEALEILSKESLLKLDTLLDAVSGNALSELQQETISEVQELLELEDLECDSEGEYEAGELNERLLATIADADIGIKFDDVASHWTLCLNWLNSEEANTADLEQAYEKSINALSEACALEMCKLHKIAELLLVKPHHSTANEVDGIVQLCKQFNGHLQGLTQRYAARLSSKSAEQEDCKTRVNTLFAEMLSAVKYIEQAYKLFTSILQMGAV
ncbi:hypothetical protein KR044_003016 [Drosophila immigrans]|nr:hypothetical protein KR044_003016 [Drosophila immigrans]